MASKKWFKCLDCVILCDENIHDLRYNRSISSGFYMDLGVKLAWLLFKTIFYKWEGV